MQLRAHRHSSFSPLPFSHRQHPAVAGLAGFVVPGFPRKALPPPRNAQIPKIRKNLQIMPCALRISALHIPPLRALVSVPLMLSRLRSTAGGFDEWLLAELKGKYRATAKKIACTTGAFP
jgi:hypothetical protein